MTRQTFASNPDEAIVMRLECEARGQITLICLWTVRIRSNPGSLAVTLSQ